VSFFKCVAKSVTFASVSRLSASALKVDAAERENTLLNKKNRCLCLRLV
jgi:hypothetical protein